MKALKDLNRGKSILVTTIVISDRVDNRTSNLLNKKNNFQKFLNQIFPQVSIINNLRCKLAKFYVNYLKPYVEIMFNLTKIIYILLVLVCMSFLS